MAYLNMQVIKFLLKGLLDIQNISYIIAIFLPFRSFVAAEKDVESPALQEGSIGLFGMRECVK